MEQVINISDLIGKKLNKKGTLSVIPWNANMASRTDMRMIDEAEAKKLLDLQRKDGLRRRNSIMAQQLEEANIAAIHQQSTVMVSPEELQTRLNSIAGVKEAIKTSTPQTNTPIQELPATIKIKAGSPEKKLNAMSVEDIQGEMKRNYSYTPVKNTKRPELIKILACLRQTGNPPVPVIQEKVSKEDAE